MRKEFLEAEFGDRQVTQLLISERYLHLPPAKLTARRSGDKIEITTTAFARQERSPRWMQAGPCSRTISSICRRGENETLP